MAELAGPLCGFERDLHELLDDFVDQVLEGGAPPTLATFTAVWQQHHASFIHQAYPGCESSPDYVQLLFATVLERLDNPSPLPQGAFRRNRSALTSGGEPLPGALLALPAPASMQGSPHHQQLQHQHQQQQQQHTPEQQEQLTPHQSRQHQQQPPLGREPPPPGSPARPGPLSTALVLSPLSPAAALAAVPDPGPAYLDDLLWLLDEPPAGERTGDDERAAGTGVTGQGGGAGGVAPAVQPHAGVGDAGAGGGSVGSPTALRQADGGLWDVLEEMLGADAVGPLEMLTDTDQGGQQQQQQQQQQEEEQGRLRQTQDEQQSLGTTAAAAAEAKAAEAAASVAPAAAAAAHGAPAEPAASAEEPHQTRALIPVAAPEEPTTGAVDDWLFEQDEAAAAEKAAQDARSAQEEVITTAAVVYALHCLHQTQHLAEPAAIYAPLPLLRILTARVPALGPAGAADAARVLRALLRSGTLVPGAVRRPVPRLTLLSGEAAAAPGKRGAAGTAAPWAVSAGVQREALFHVKAALKGLANFRRLQVLCDEYANARSAIFGPLGMRSGEEQQQQQQRPQQRRQAGSAPAGRPGPDVAALALPAWAVGGRASAGGLAQAQARATEAAAATPAAPAPEGASPEQVTRAALPPRLARGEEPPVELFEGSFGDSLQRLAVTEAAALLGALRPSDPHTSGARGKRARAGDTAGDAGTPGQRPRLEGERADGTRMLTGMAARLYGPAAVAASQQQQQQQQPERQQRQQQRRRQQQGQQGASQREAPAPRLLHTDDLTAVGLPPATAPQGGSATVRTLAGGGRGVALALAAQEERRQRAMQAAESWFAAHDRLLTGRPIAFDAATADGEQDNEGAAAVWRRGSGAGGVTPAGRSGARRGGRGQRSG